MKKTHVLLMVGLFGVGLTLTGNPARAALSVEVKVPQLYLPPGGAALLEGTLTNTGTTTLYLNGGSSTVSPEYARDDQFEFIETLVPTQLTAGEIWQGPLLQLRLDGLAPEARATFSLTLLGGPLTRSQDILNTTFFVLDDSTTVSGTGPGDGLPPAILLTARPNPFATSTTLHFVLDDPATVDVAAYNVQGQLIRHLGERALGAGAQDIEWDGRDDEGRPAQSGIYFLRVSAGDRRLKTSVVRLR